MPTFNNKFYNWKDPDQMREYNRLYSREWREKNPDKHKACVQRHYEKLKSDPELWRKQMKNTKTYFTPETKEKNRQRAAKYYAQPENRAKHLERAQKRYANDEEFRKRSNERSKARYQELKRLAEKKVPL
jgi:ABC-type nitrate/sulfonate/bicarbonate transport system substrate-binding protein